MAVKYYTILTKYGANVLAQATALGQKINLTEMAVGDGNGKVPTPSEDNTKLVKQVRKAPINELKLDPNNPAQIIAEQVIPAQDGGWWIREVGLYDDKGKLFAIGNCPETYKPKLEEGSGRDQVIRMVLIVSSSNNIELKIDPAVVLATQEFVITQMAKKADEKHKHTADDLPKATSSAQGITKLSSATNSDSQTEAATPKAVKDMGDKKLDKTSASDFVKQSTTNLGKTGIVLTKNLKTLKDLYDLPVGARVMCSGVMPLLPQIPMWAVFEKINNRDQSNTDCLLHVHDYLGHQMWIVAITGTTLNVTEVLTDKSLLESVTGVRLGARVSIESKNIDPGKFPTGSVMVGVKDYNNDYVPDYYFYRPLQILVKGTWKTVGVV